MASNGAEKTGADRSSDRDEIVLQWCGWGRLATADVSRINMAASSQQSSSHLPATRWKPSPRRLTYTGSLKGKTAVIINIACIEVKVWMKARQHVYRRERAGIVNCSSDCRVQTDWAHCQDFLPPRSSTSIIQYTQTGPTTQLTLSVHFDLGKHSVLSNWNTGSAQILFGICYQVILLGKTLTFLVGVFIFFWYYRGTLDTICYLSDLLSPPLPRRTVQTTNGLHVV